MASWKDDYTQIKLGTETFLCHCSGIVFHEKTETLIVSDLHLEKGSSYADSGQLLPPYDSLKTLKYLCHMSFILQPKVVVALGDSFHDANGPARLGIEEHQMINQVRVQAEWIWIIGNHDSELPPNWPDHVMQEYYIGNVVLRHEAAELKDGDVEITGHFHPKALAKVRGKNISKRCFAFDSTRMIMPAFGSYTGGLNVLEAPVREVFQERPFNTLMMGSKGLFSYPSQSLVPPKRTN